MSRRAITAEPRGPAVEAFLLGTLDYDLCLALQDRLVFETSGRSDGQIALLICEHPLGITVGRRGSWSHIHLDRRELISRGIDVRWVNRGDGCMVHAPGQLAVYPIVPLDWHGFTVGDYLDRLQSGLSRLLAEFHVPQITRPGKHGIWSRGGQLAGIGVAVKRWTTYHGAFVNVRPTLAPFRFVDTDPEGGTRFSSLMAQRQRPVKMTAVRAAAVRHVASALGCDRYHVYTGHPLLAEVQRVHVAATSRVG